MVAQVKLIAQSVFEISVTFSEVLTNNRILFLIMFTVK